MPNPSAARPTGGAGRPSERTAERLADADPELLATAGLEAQAMRRSILRGSTIVMVGVGYHSKRFIYERAAELGVHQVLIDHPGHWGEDLVTEGIAQAFLPADLHVPVPEQVEQVLRLLDSLPTPPDAICTFWEDSPPVIARVAAKLGLPGNAPEAIDAARSKRLTLVMIESAGIPTPRFSPIADVGDVGRAAEHVGFPAVIKPEFGCSSIGCYRVDSLAEARRAYVEIEPILPSLEPIFAEYGTNLILEEYLDGPEFDIDMVLWEGACQYHAVAENWPTNEPYFFETGLHAPSLYDPDRLQAIVDLAISATTGLGLENGVFHVEAKDTSKGPRIVEVNARMGGTTVRDSNLLIHGVDLVEEHLLAAVGIPVRPFAAPEPLCAVTNLLLYAQQTGTLASTDFVEEAAADPRVFFANSDVAKGDRVVAAADGIPTELLELALREVDVPTATAAIRDLAAGLDISYL
jgi:biotin carboxylase